MLSPKRLTDSGFYHNRNDDSNRNLPAGLWTCTQYNGHDSKYPAWPEVNQNIVTSGGALPRGAETGVESLGNPRACPGIGVSA